MTHTKFIIFFATKKWGGTIVMSFILFVTILCMLTGSAYSQSIIANPKSATITSKKAVSSDLLVPIELDVVNASSSSLSPTLKVDIDNTTAQTYSQFPTTDISNIKIINDNQTLTIDAHKTVNPLNTFYLFIDKTVAVSFEKIIYLKISSAANLLCTIKVIIQPEDKIFTLDDYLRDENILDYVVKVESNNNTLTVNGFRRDEATTHDAFVKRTVELRKGEVLAVNEWSWIANSSHWQPIPISLITVPFKVRRKITSNGKEFMGSTTSGISNIGFNLDLGKYQRDRYFATGKKSTHRFSLGLTAAPSVEELDSVYTFGAKGALGKAPGKMEKSKQLFISAGITLSYSYNDISFVFVPYGWDFATSSIGKSWIYNKQRWWGFGLAISPKIFATILNK